ncbi:MAG TPA: pseudouridine-5'-phosphate glycosidase [Candidatus Ozemobacteraceae bacterium]|nr:pseudouridine-5'-phosphate glycosidase [Candidatus Ozemobacteraceae bacterium]
MKDIILNKEVASAVSRSLPVVALESTIITHGMPYPENVKTAREVEEVVRAGGCVPATIALLDGTIRVGLSDEELEMLGQAKGAVKIGRRDLAAAIVQKKNGGTTVSGTMICAAKAGIRFFATGGIGGVHRGGEATFDVSADLEELARTPVAVVSAGAKAILDLPKTLEYLETAGVPVIGFGTDEFPAFYSRRSGLHVPIRFDEPRPLAAMIRKHWDLGLGSGVLVANPIPGDSEYAGDEINQAIEAALKEADAKGVQGAATTPFLLERVYQLTQGKSLTANIALVKNNALLASQLASAFAAIERGSATIGFTRSA